MKNIISATLLLTATSLNAQTLPLKEETPGLLKQARVTPAVASANALARVPGGKLTGAEIEREGGKLVYVYAIKVAGKTGVEEVAVDAMTGAIVSSVHESPEDEAAEAKADKAKGGKAKAASVSKPKAPPVSRPAAKPPV